MRFNVEFKYDGSSDVHCPRFLSRFEFVPRREDKPSRAHHVTHEAGIGWSPLEAKGNLVAGRNDEWFS